MEPLLTVITVTYKDPKGLKATVESLESLNDLQIPWEHVIVDSSPDLSAPLLQSLSSAWPLVHLKEPPKGIYSAMNTGIAEAKGMVVHFLNSGDVLKSAASLRGILERFTQESKIDLVLAGADLMRQERFLYPHRHRSGILRNLLGTNRICHQAVLYRLSALRSVGNFSTKWKFAGDYEHHYRFYLSGMKSLTVPVSIVGYDMDGSSSQYRSVMKEFRLIQKELSKQLGFFVATANTLMFYGEWMRIEAVKLVSRSNFNKYLRPLWLTWKRWS